MKLRYQMRGLGIGIFVTALLMGVATKEGRPLTDAEIKAKAYALGMVDSESIRLTDLKGTSQPPQGTTSPQSTAPPKETTTPQETTAPQETTSPQETAAPQETTAPQETAAPKETTTPQETTAPQETAVPQETTSPQETVAPQSPGNDSSGEAVLITIRAGANSYGVSVQLAEAGLVEDAEVFDSYLCDNGYAGRLRIGVYRIVPGTGAERIAKIITGTES